MKGPWSVFYTVSALEFISNEVSSERVARKIFEYRSLLESFPDLGRAYDPEYSAARPPFLRRCIAVPDTPFVLYYLKEEEGRRIVIFCIDYRRRDPNARFSEYEWKAIEW